MLTFSKLKYLLYSSANYRFSFHRKLNSLCLWEEELDTNIRLRIEKRWNKNVMLQKISNKENNTSYYVLPMFPYPSGNLHMGHVRVYSISDTIARFQKLNGKNVIHPMGWDAFGLPAENAALERSIPPHHWTSSNIETMKMQLLQLGFNFDWSKEVSTCDPQYYKWTQFIFIKLFESGLAYQNKALVNWDPVDKTVLADEQVDELGCSWRSGATVEKKILTQWFIRTTKYAKKLYDGLNSELLENWKDIINLQKHWIGECNGISLNFKVVLHNQNKFIDVWTSEPYKFIHGQFLTISSSSIIIQDLSETEKCNLMAVNPITHSAIPVYVIDDANYPEGRDININCPTTNEVDRKIASRLNIDVINCKAINIEEENRRAISMALSEGGHFTSSKLKDWLISRQRYWGTPIPIIHCSKCGAVPVPYEDLPVKLPINLKPNKNTLEKMDKWVNCKCPKCKSNALRETDTMDTFVDSSWYFYRFLDSTNDIEPFNKKKLEGCVPVDMYIGGKEHAVLHLYYARFMSYFLHSLGWTPTEEPFKKLLVQGMVMGQSYKIKASGKYIPPENVEKIDNNYKEKNTGEIVSVQWEKMSKSKHNGENPIALLSTYGCDTTRLLILSDVPPATSRHWSDATFPGALNWQKRLWLTMRDFLRHRNNISANNNTTLSEEEFRKHESTIRNSRNYFTATTTYHFRHTQQLSVGISRLQSLTNTLRSNLPPEVIAKSEEFEIALGTLLIMLAPVTPHFCSELWAGFVSAPHRICEPSSVFDWDSNVLDQRWPRVDDEYQLSFLCKVDGADRCDLKIKATELDSLSQEEAVKLMIKQNAVSKRIKRGIKKIKYDLYPGCRAILYLFTNRKADSDKKKEFNSAEL